jgi:hypothetical protein
MATQTTKPYCLAASFAAGNGGQWKFLLSLCEAYVIHLFASSIKNCMVTVVHLGVKQHGDADNSPSTNKYTFNYFLELNLFNFD